MLSIVSKKVLFAQIQIFRKGKGKEHEHLEKNSKEDIKSSQQKSTDRKSLGLECSSSCDFLSKQSQ